ncbi:hypothetical protein INR49_015748 [Caranx melampygus]|nr:hypothetical protein INR49_015748 [Caranx melampygus]
MWRRRRSPHEEGGEGWGWRRRRRRRRRKSWIPATQADIVAHCGKSRGFSVKSSMSILTEQLYWERRS